MKCLYILLMAVSLAIPCSGIASSELARFGAASVQPSQDRAVKLFLDSRAQGAACCLSFPVGTNWVDFVITKTQLAGNTNRPPEQQIPIGALINKSKAEVERLFPHPPGWQFEKLTMKRFSDGSDRFRNLQRYGKITSPAGEWSETWVYLIEWTRITKTEAQSISIPILLTGEVGRGVIVEKR